jgi:hypothetical protein
MTVTIDLIDTLPAGVDVHDVRIVLMDALAEYVSHRANGHAEAYVDQRYPGEDVYRGQARVDKIASVDRRCKLARCLHGFSNVKVGS